MKIKPILSILLFGIVTTCFGQQKTTWDKWNWLIGEWVGEGNGQTGQGGGTFSLKPDLDNKILIRKSHAEYPASGNRPEIIHDDLMIVFLDNSGNPSTATYFDNEGHVINYAITYPEKSIVLTSDKTKDSPVFRLTYSLLDNGTVNVKFEMSGDGEKFSVYTEGTCRKMK